ncbi:hypothetical protein D3C84_587630 [compost metagenome]
MKKRRLPLAFCNMNANSASRQRDMPSSLEAMTVSRLRKYVVRIGLKSSSSRWHSFSACGTSGSSVKPKCRITRKKPSP